ncbi:MAG: response regulator transcription factor [Candidatus Spechtbacteria bacterium]|nr:response regulator transcription factor [Candidatus Spechtbacteria bacterium]
MPQKILLIEDDPFLSEIYVTKFHEAGFMAVVAEDGVFGLEKVKEVRPDIVILDIVMPNMDGFELLRKIKKDEDLKFTPVVILSNLGEQENVEKGFGLGAADYIIKAHYTPTEVVAKVKEILKNKK